MTVVKLGRQSVEFQQPPRLISGAATAGPQEGRGPLSSQLDYIFPQMRWGRFSFEKCEQQMQEKTARIALEKAGIGPEQVELLCSGDLINQITPSSLTARSLDMPFLGLFSACSTVTEALSVAAIAVDSGVAAYALAVAGSHTCTAERQFRYPNEYGSQKPPCAQHTVTACGAAVLGREGGAVGVTALTLGRVKDAGVFDPFQVGAAMAPAFAQTVAAHLRERQVEADHYDLILSGDLGRDGLALGLELLREQGVSGGHFDDCGLLLIGADDKCAGGSGCGCAAAVGLGHILGRLQKGELRRVLLCATGALFSPLTNQQKESIPAICHAVALEYVGDQAEGGRAKGGRAKGGRAKGGRAADKGKEAGDHDE